MSSEPGNDGPGPGAGFTMSSEPGCGVAACPLFGLNAGAGVVPTDCEFVVLPFPSGVAAGWPPSPAAALAASEAADASWDC